MDLSPGNALGHYEILERLGAGGMGVVFGARDTKLGRRVALKILPPTFADSPEHFQRFKREARVLAALSHPNIATIYAIEDESDSGPFLVLERVEGETLAARLRDGPLPIREALRISRSIAVALEAAHERGIVHRDLKPGNVMLTASGQVKVLDFGLAQWTPRGFLDGATGNTTMEASLTRSGFVVGTPAYMSPEQVRGDTQDERTDVFAFGSALYESLCGVPAFQGGSAAEVMAAVLRGAPDWSALPGPTPPKLRNLLRRCLEKNPRERPGAMAEIRAEIDAVLEGAAASPEMIGDGADEAAATIEVGAATVESAPRAEAKTPHNLPAQLTTFVGRKREIGECARHLEKGRLLTLTGIGGSGKSRLMLRVAEGLLATYPDGVWFVDLAPLSDPERVTATLAAALGLRQSAGESLERSVAEYLRERNALVLFDNCEHMLHPVAERLVNLLRGTRRLRIIATSREALHVEGEQIYPVAPLSLPEPAAATHPDVAARSEAVRLFVERAGLVRPHFALDAQSTPVVVEICTRLDGIPLALELAAARMKALSVQDVRSRLDDRFRLLTGGKRGALPRHQTLRATIEWSHDHLSPEEQRLLRGLSVFAGGWTVEAATAVGGLGRDEVDVMDLLAALSEKSLVNIEWSPASESRYRFLETVRQFALEKLRNVGEVEARRNDHLDFMVRFAERAESELVGPDQETWFQRVEAEHENLLAALAWSEGPDVDPEIGLRLAGALWRFWWFGGHFPLGLARSEAALHRDSVAIPTPARAQALYGAAQMAREMGDYVLAREHFQASLRVAEALGDDARIARAFNGLGNTAEYAGDYDEARDYHERALAISRRLGNVRAVAIDLNNLGIVHMIQEDYAGAKPLYEEALEIFREVGDVNGAQATVTNLATIATRTGALLGACEYFRESFRLAEELPSQTLSADSLECFAELAVQMEALDLAARVLGTADEVRRSTGYALSVETKVIVEAVHARLRAELGEDVRRALDAEGRSMTFDAAVRIVRDWLSTHP